MEKLLRNQLLLDCKAMAHYALKRGKTLPIAAAQTIDTFEETPQPAIDRLVQAHSMLAKLVDPATPQAIILLQQERETGGLLKTFGPVSLVRYMMLVAITFLIIFIGVVLTSYINDQETTIFNSEGLPLFVNLLFLLSASGLGASFTALYKANKYITNLTFDPNYQASYWIRFLLGLISGLILSMVISENAIKSDLLEEGIVRPLLAILGGFSADLVYTFLNRMVETFRSLFQGSTEAMVLAQTQELKAKYGTEVIDKQMQLAASLMKIMGEIGPEVSASEIRDQLAGLLTELTPNISTSSLKQTDSEQS